MGLATYDGNLEQPWNGPKPVNAQSCSAGINDYLVPRRNDILRNTFAELRIREAMEAVEKVGAHPLLTDAVVLLSQALNKVADYVDA